ncbi:2-succinyl-5-enolpyruvyl-6-hydroxy-3-cyclohexene-1-carboxylic-acid synthase [uncultured Vibrio sp.]|uniref:2-succinyl-5-enolpyruvyl-6-hydroxy-3- cyclohexene-1-carboxylic-acid synthase n=1 Tax=uncultured Vibrio sp. TaxID=114054 RepID=UPI0029C968EA|nr:2-succinyl-5-enolpyruvyl-6-hydroxy-3-cyclohexene-1-carboxylic-acid synthase [uncultured Vibrio sp.]
MSHDQAVLNRIWSETLLIELHRFGVEHVCIAPGSRSTPLTLEAADNPNFTIHTHFDERGLGFMALGLAKASQSPVVVIVTSGTAVANLLPAVAEAKLTGEQLVLLTADRPIELVGCGANQAINQLGIFSQHVSACLNLPSPTASTPLNWLLTSIDEVMFTQQREGSAVHINCAFPEPLYSNGCKSQYQDYLSSVDVWRESDRRYTQRFAPLAVSDIPSFAHKKGLVIIGCLSLEESQAALSFAQKMGWPVLADPQSGVSSEWAHYDLWLPVPKLAQQLERCDLIVQFGSRIISKRLNQWIETQVTRGVEEREIDYWYISQRPVRNNQSHLPQLHWVESPKSWLERVSAVNSIESGWANQLKTDVEQISQHIRHSFLSTLSFDLNEVALAVDVEDRAQSVDVFLGNSLFVRLVDMFGRLSDCEVFSNRGASGIDGVLATASGVQRSHDNPLLVYIGDTSALYDLNSLSLFTHAKRPAVIVITNNDGGAIFDILPVPQEHRQTYYQMPHGYQFEHAAKQFGLSYQQPKTLEQYQALVSNHFENGQGTLVIEVQTPPSQAVELIKIFNKNLHAKF